MEPASKPVVRWSSSRSLPDAGRRHFQSYPSGGVLILIERRRSSYERNGGI
jgi:hypothetical protein